MSCSNEEDSAEAIELEAETASLLAKYRTELTPEAQRRDRLFVRVRAQTEESTRSSDEQDEADERASGSLS